MTPSAASRRPRVICHMMTSLDGRILTDGWPLSAEGRKQYEQIHQSYEADGWLCGRVTMEQHFAQGTRPESEVKQEHHGTPREDFIAPGEHESYAFALDEHGRLAWDSNDIDGDHVVAVLSQRVSDRYLEFLRGKGVSYLLCGAHDVDLALMLRKIGERFGVKTLMLEGGGRINGSLLHAGLIDEVSVIVSPVADGRMGTPALFDVDVDDVRPHRLALDAVERRADDTLWLRYRVTDGRI